MSPTHFHCPPSSVLFVVKSETDNNYRFQTEQIVKSETDNNYRFQTEQYGVLVYVLYFNIVPFILFFYVLFCRFYRRKNKIVNKTNI